MAEGTLWKELKGQNGGGGAVFETCIAWKVGVGEQGGRIFRVKEGEKEREAEVVYAERRSELEM